MACKNESGKGGGKKGGKGGGKGGGKKSGGGKMPMPGMPMKGK